MVRCLNVKGKHGIFSLSFITSSQHFIIIQSDQDLFLLTKLMNTTEYMNGQKQSREAVQMHIPASILHKSTSGRHRPVSYPDGPMTARYRFM